MIRVRGERFFATAFRLLTSGVPWIVAAVAFAMATDLVRPLDDGLSAARFNALRRPVSGQIAVVEIDVPSLRAAGQWPWGRERFGRAVSNLEAAGARTVGFDVDFSASSNARSDDAFAKAIAAKPGTVILPTFVQPVNDGQGGTKMAENTPLKDLANEALIASVNIPVDDDGRVRHYRFGFGEGQTYRRSMGAEMAEAPGQRTRPFIIDYSVRARDIPRFSFEDIYEGRFDPVQVKGRNILIGATALELGDEFSTPQKSAMNGVYIHAIAFENLLTGRALSSPAPWLIVIAALGLVLLLRPTRPGATVASLARRHLAVAAAVMITPFAVQAFLPVSLPVAALLLAQALCVAWATRVELERRARAIVDAREAALMHQALHDPETGLTNRRTLLARITEGSAEADGQALSVVTLGIDRFPAMRGAVGYSLSNDIVRGIAARLSGGGEDAVAHISTSVLGLVVRGDTEEEVKSRIEALTAHDTAYVVGGHPVDAFLRFGVAPLCAADSEPERLLEHASLALDQARREDVALVTFDAQTYADPEINLALMSEMLNGLESGDLELFYQPKLSLAGDAVRGAEGLIRWKHPTRGFIRPDVFIAIAEETGAIRELTEWTLRRALQDGDALLAGGHDLLLSVNISGRLLTDNAFCEALLATVAGRRHGLCLEITETAVISNPAAAAAAIADFRAAGLKISIDDYGVGLSSVSYLKMLDAHELKIDKSLVEAVCDSERDRLILKSTVDLAHGLGMVVVAEGVEERPLMEALRTLGCDIIQGYLISKPLPLSDFTRFVAAWGEERLAAAS